MPDTFAAAEALASACAAIAAGEKCPQEVEARSITDGPPFAARSIMCDAAFRAGYDAAKREGS